MSSLLFASWRDIRAETQQQQISVASLKRAVVIYASYQSRFILFKDTAHSSKKPHSAYRQGMKQHLTGGGETTDISKCKEFTGYTNTLVLRIFREKSHRPGKHLIASRRECKNARPGTAAKAERLGQPNAFWSSLALPEWAGRVERLQISTSSEEVQRIFPNRRNRIYSNRPSSHQPSAAPSLWQAHLAISFTAPLAKAQMLKTVQMPWGTQHNILGKKICSFLLFNWH